MCLIARCDRSARPSQCGIDSAVSAPSARLPDVSVHCAWREHMIDLMSDFRTLKMMAIPDGPSRTPCPLHQPLPSCEPETVASRLETICATRLAA